jgi:LysR family transcriptional regulator, hydrogen peroxide-inducible genes activator
MRSMPPFDASDLSLTQLEYLLAVDAERHFGRAARAMGVTQPTLSMQLGKLERTIGARLFDRARTPVVPTETGRRVIAQARAVLHEAARLAEAAEPEEGQVTGELRLGVIPTVAPYLLPRLIARVSIEHPGLSLVVEERVTDDLVARVLAGDLDAAIVATEPGLTGLIDDPLYVEPFVAYVSEGHRLSGAAQVRPRDLSPDDLWLLSEGHCLRVHAVSACRRRPSRRAGRRAEVGGCTSAARFESGNLETLKRLVEQGIGMTLLPALAATEGPAPSRTVRIVSRRERPRTRLVDAVATAVRASVPATLR